MGVPGSVHRQRAGGDWPSMQHGARPTIEFNRSVPSIAIVQRQNHRVFADPHHCPEAPPSSGLARP
jgi:hypothetical protein